MQHVSISYTEGNCYINQLLHLFRILPLYVPDNILKSVQLKLIYKLKHQPQLTRRKALVMIPNHIIFREFYKIIAFIFAERHFSMCKFDKKFFLLVQKVKVLKIKMPL